ncbi:MULTISPECIES: type I polyketide synthase [Enterobacter cloacae complex]|uniref:type I polyketide synthase n=1 Tax=Enterobacter cloacae complex TaxID=354276 RepID=UPI0007946D43|nr:type I polyketide synthase [Enterobacter ludwigii]WNI43099.1 beta-ketoacyl synthase N-terminal-like domain-containing protein [Enterobacter ludwigii]WNI52152.1 beta-ketoacyl synthase N-terminal-like domain-containing protein [Enterobacter ludwigii]WNI83926.1 beta-ketoacyl synthase N-terminal-like domain-containing protein [Enterobacter ludwigii]SAC79188.1 iron aquisition yersiniabactin synthesis enzyme (Irp2) [Enterobacter ludwigii]
MIKKIILEQLQKRQITPECAKILLTSHNGGAKSRDIAITGLSCKFPGASDPDTFWHNLTEGKSFLGPLPSGRRTADFKGELHGGFLDEDIHAFDASFFDIPDEEARQMDPQQKYFLEHAWAAIENAGYVPSSLQNKKCGVYAAIGGGDYFLTQKTITPYTASGFLNAFLVSRLSYFLNLTGPCLVVDSACTSALSALHLAGQSLLAQETDIMLVGSFNILSSSHIHELCQQSGLLSPSNLCRPFSSRADGWLPGEGGGVLVLRRLADAVADGDHIYGVIKGSGINHNGHSNGMQAPKASRQVALQQHVCEEAGIEPGTIDYLEVQGVCNLMGDSIEFQAMRQGLTRPEGSACFVTTTKPNIGHLLAASGMAGVIKILMSIKYQAIPPIASLQEINPALGAEQGSLVLNRDLTNWRSVHTPRRAAINAFGLTGVNAHMIIEEPPVTQATAIQARSYYVFCLSAKNSRRLAGYRRRLAEYLQENPDISLPALAYTLQTGREMFNTRDAIVAGTLTEVIEQLKHPLPFVDEVAVPDRKDIADLLLRDDLESCQLLAQYWCMGHPVAWEKSWRHQDIRRILLPGRPFIASTEPAIIGKSTLHALPDSNRLLHRRCEKYIADTIYQQTGYRIDECDYHKNFINLGINSVSLFQLSDLLEKQSGIGLNPVIYFEYPNITALANYIVEKHAVGLTAFLTFYKPHDTATPLGAILSMEEQGYLSVCEELVALSERRIATMSDILMQENTPENRARWPIEKEVFDIADDFYQRFNMFAEIHLAGKNLSRAFIQQLHQKVTQPFLNNSQILKRFFDKPRGYAGDFETIKMMYEGQPEGQTLLAFWLDKWAHQLGSMTSVQNRRKFIREHIRMLAGTQPDSPLAVMSIACGPASEIFESLTRDSVNLSAVCIDLDDSALDYVRKTAAEQGVEERIACIRENAFRLSDTFISHYAASQKLIYSIGLIDYFEDEFIITLLNQLYNLLQPGGYVILGNICDKCPEKHISNYLLDWLIIYRSKEQMYNIFKQSRFNHSDIEVTVYNQDTSEIQLYAVSKK